MDSISLDDGRYFYFPEYNTIINREFRDLFLAHGGDRKLTLRPHQANPEILRTNMVNLSQLILEVTQDCNLNCKYCLYGDAFPFNRPPSKKEMDPAVAKKAIDYVFGLVKNRPNREFIVAFYGGEPLMNFPLVKTAMEYAKKTFADWTLQFNLTSNLTILTDEMVDFLTENHVRLTVSLDGPKENHDAKRVFPDGLGSFEIVMRNLRKIKKKSPALFRSIAFNAVFSNDLSLGGLFDFFMGNPIVNGNTVRMSGVDDYKNSYYSFFPNHQDRVKNDARRIMGGILDRKEQRKALKPIEESLLSPISMCEFSLKERSCSSLASTCLFDHRLYADAVGTFHVCERVNNTFPLGDVDRGLDFERMEGYLNQFCRIVENDCSPCPYRCLCHRCFSTFAADGIFALYPEYCKSQALIVPNYLNHLVSIKKRRIT